MTDWICHIFEFLEGALLVFLVGYLVWAVVVYDYESAGVYATEILAKDTHTIYTHQKVGNITTTTPHTNYYFYVDGENEEESEISVSSSVYSKHEVGDTILLRKYNKIYKPTGEIVKVKYEWAGN